MLAGAVGVSIRLLFMMKELLGYRFISARQCAATHSQLCSLNLVDFCLESGVHFSLL
jgi:hypothetical protein